MQSPASIPWKDEAAGRMVPGAAGPRPSVLCSGALWMGQAQPCAIFAGHPLARTVSPRARDSKREGEQCRGRWLLSFPTAPRRLGRPRHSPALSSRFRSVSAAPVSAAPSSPPARPTADPSPAQGLPSLGRDPRQSGSGCTHLPSHFRFWEGDVLREQPKQQPCRHGQETPFHIFPT